jgi:hypothetical protein
MRRPDREERGFYEVEELDDVTTRGATEWKAAHLTYEVTPATMSERLMNGGWRAPTSTHTC